MALRQTATIPASIKRTTGLIVSFLLCCMFIPATAFASAGVSQGFTTASDNIVAGTIVGLKSGSQDTVVPAVSTQSYRLLGVVASQSLIALGDGTSKVQVVTSGAIDALVSDINGSVKAGDAITASPVEGVGMKAIEAGQIVGVAQSDLSASHPVERTITDKDGQKHTVHVGTIPIRISVSYYTNQATQGKLASFVPPGLLSLANNVAGREVSALRVLLCFAALLLGFIIVANMLQSGVRASITAVGRNPLAKSAIRKELLDVCLTALGVLALTVILVYVGIRV